MRLGSGSRVPGRMANLPSDTECIPGRGHRAREQEDEECWGAAALTAWGLRMVSLCVYPLQQSLSLPRMRLHKAKVNAFGMDLLRDSQVLRLQTDPNVPQVPPSALQLHQPREQNLSEAIAELLSHVAMDECSRMGFPRTAPADTLSLPVKLLWCSGIKPSRDPGSKVTHRHFFSIACVSVGACVRAPAACICCNLCLVWLEINELCKREKRNFSQIVVTVNSKGKTKLIL